MFKKLLSLSLVGAFMLIGCGDDTATNEKTEEETEITYEQKDLTADDISNIVYGDDLDTVYETLGAPLTEWTSEFVYDSLDDAISRNELTVELVGDSNDEFVEAAKSEIDNANKAKEIDRLKLIQYTYTYEEDTEETALFWISPRTDTVVASDQRSYMDEDGESLDTDNKDSHVDDSDQNIETNIENTYSIGDSAVFTSDDGDMMEVTIDSVSKDSGDDWHTPTEDFFAKVDFTVENTGSTAIDVNSHFFEFYDSDDIKSESISKDFFSETIQQGKTAKGSVYFDVLSGGSTFEVYFIDSPWTGEYQE